MSWKGSAPRIATTPAPAGALLTVVQHFGSNFWLTLLRIRLDLQKSSVYSETDLSGNTDTDMPPHIWYRVWKHIQSLTSFIQEKEIVCTHFTGGMTEVRLACIAFEYCS